MSIPTLVQSIGVSPASTTTANVTLGTGGTNNSGIAATAGNTILAFWETDASAGNSVITDNVNAGTHYQLVKAGSTPSGGLIGLSHYFGIAGGNTTVTQTYPGSATQLRFWVQEWANLDSLIPFEQAPATSSGTSTTPTGNATGTLAEVGELIVAWSVAFGGGTWVAGSGFTLDPNIATNGGRMVEYMVANNTNAVTPAFSGLGSGSWAVVVAAYRAAHTRKTIFVTNSGPFVAPADWPGTADKAEVVGAGGAGCHAAAANSGVGGGGGAYTYLNALAVPNGSTLQVGGGGQTSGASGTDTWVISTSTLFAKHGAGGAVGVAGAGGAAASCIPSANAFSGGNGGTPASNTSAGATGGGGAAGPFGAGANAGTQAGTGVTGGTGAGAGGGGAVGVNQANSTQAGTAGGTYSSAYGAIAGNGGVGGASGANAGGAGNGRISPPPVSCGSGGGGGGSDGSGNGGNGGVGGSGAEWVDVSSNIAGSGGGGGGSGEQTSGSTVVGGNGGNYGAGGGGVGGSGGTGMTPGLGANGIIVFTYTPFSPTNNPQWIYNRKYVHYYIN